MSLQFLPNTFGRVDHGQAHVREATLVALSSLRPRFHAGVIARAIGRLNDRVVSVRDQALKVVVKMGRSIEAQHIPSLIGKVKDGQCSFAALENVPTALLAPHFEALREVYGPKRLVQIAVNGTAFNGRGEERLLALRALKAHFTRACLSEQIELVLQHLVASGTDMLKLLSALDVGALKPNVALMFDLVFAYGQGDHIDNERMSGQFSRFLRPIFSPFSASPQLASTIAAHLNNIFNDIGASNIVTLLDIIDTGTLISDLVATPNALAIVNWLIYNRETLSHRGHDACKLLRKLGPTLLREHAATFVSQLLLPEADV